MLEFDRALFHAINGAWTNALFDLIMPIVTNQSNWVPILIMFWLGLFFGAGGRFRRLAVLLALVVTLSDQTSSHLIKPICRRMRPCCVETEKRLLVPCSHSKSFPSSHAANSAAVAGFVWLECGTGIGLPALCLSALISYSRVYVGVHYPLDVVGGMIIGLVLASAFFFIARRFWPPRTNQVKIQPSPERVPL